MHDRTRPSAPTRTYADYAQPLWRRLLLTREIAVIALLVAVIVCGHRPSCRTSTARSR